MISDTEIFQSEEKLGEIIIRQHLVDYLDNDRYDSIELKNLEDLEDLRDELNKIISEMKGITS